MPKGPRPLSDDEVEILEGLLDEFPSENHMEAEELEGFLAAAMAPCGNDLRFVETAVRSWLGYILGVDNNDVRVFVPALDSPDLMRDSEAVAPLILRHALSLHKQLLNDEAIDPILSLDHRNQVSGAGWAHGYLRGMALDMRRWQALLDDEEEDEFLAPMLRLSAQDQPAPAPRERDRLIDQMVGGAAFASQWFARQAKAST